MISTIARTATIFAAAALVAGASLPAAASIADPAPASAPAAKPAKEKRYCVTQVTTGTMLKAPKVCKTRDQWVAETGNDPIRK
jgi:hypothetical protein